MANVRIVTDSASDLPAALAAHYGITIVPLSIRFGDEEFMNDRALSPEAFWERCANSPTLPESAAPSPGAFQVAFENALADGCSGVVVVALTSLLSATYQAALVAADAVRGQIDVRVLDTRAVSMSEGLLAIELAELAASGASLDEVAARGTALIPKLDVIATIDTLEHLIKGGRLGGAKAFLGQVLAVKPLVKLQDGVVAEAGRARTRTKALVAIAEFAREHGPFRRFALMSSAEDTQALVDLVKDIPTEFPLVITEIGPVVGTHAGPGVIGLSWITA